MKRLIMVGMLLLAILPVGAETIYDLPNGGFENASENWYIRHGYSLDNITIHSGNWSLKSSLTYYDPDEDPSLGDARAIWSKGIRGIEAGDKVYASGYMKIETNTSDTDCVYWYGARYGIDYKKEDGTIIKANNGDWVSWNSSGDWEFGEYTRIVPEGTVRINFWLQTKPHNCSGTAWFDDMTLIITRNSTNEVISGGSGGSSLDEIYSKEPVEQVTLIIEKKPSFFSKIIKGDFSPIINVLVDFLDGLGVG